MARPGRTVRRGDPELYEVFADQWWDPRGVFAMLHWLAASRAALVPEARRRGSVLVDLGCGAGLLAPRIAERGHLHVGVDTSTSALRHARERGVRPVLADVADTPLADGSADCVVAGEVLEHVPDLPRVIAEACRLLRPGGVLVLDSLAATARCRLLAIGLAERIPGLAPRGVHDPALLVDRATLVTEAALHGVPLALRGIRPDFGDLASFFVGRGEHVRMRPTGSTAVLFQGVGRKSPAPAGGGP
ncbi:methyltransferase domain-containing protein [Saccharopolyspora sp. HNM0983]|uniref:Methyltransferase domain-containing protein n=1 Tax=Saccharopolyspora montiporae TaxID=2781240 RepID=A0A929BCR4_9PSEU|nr:methyltransferase domain-containing protein [Saccharopolyspora sp. HNM0983]MBE9375970.1 methyltransferase domain-containing protein [Saccharopolyspora sp. HNM0983]